MSASTGIQFCVDGEPKGQPRPRAFAKKMGGKFVARVYDAGTAEGWKSAIATAARPHLPPAPMNCPMSVSILLHLKRPKRLCRKKDDPGCCAATCKPDCDNFAKAILDALTQVGMWVDDALVTKLSISKEYHAIGGKPGATICVEVLQ